MPLTSVPLILLFSQLHRQLSVVGVQLCPCGFLRSRRLCGGSGRRWCIRCGGCPWCKVRGRGVCGAVSVVGAALRVRASCCLRVCVVSAVVSSLLVPAAHPPATAYPSEGAVAVGVTEF